MVGVPCRCLEQHDLPQRQVSAPSQTNSPVAPRAEWPAILRGTTMEVFATMVGVPVTATDQAATPTAPQLTAMVGIAGPLCATFSIRCSTASAAIIASHM